jgi:hypothetical protein
MKKKSILYLSKLISLLDNLSIVIHKIYFQNINENANSNNKTRLCKIFECQYYKTVCPFFIFIGDRYIMKENEINQDEYKFIEIVEPIINDFDKITKYLNELSLDDIDYDILSLSNKGICIINSDSNKEIIYFNEANYYNQLDTNILEYKKLLDQKLIHNQSINNKINKIDDSLSVKLIKDYKTNNSKNHPRGKKKNDKQKVSKPPPIEKKEEPPIAIEVQKTSPKTNTIKTLFLPTIKNIFDVYKNNKNTSTTPLNESTTSKKDNEPLNEIKINNDVEANENDEEDDNNDYILVDNPIKEDKPIPIVQKVKVENTISNKKKSIHQKTQIINLKFEDNDSDDDKDNLVSLFSHSEKKNRSNDIPIFNNKSNKRMETYFDIFDDIDVDFGLNFVCYEITAFFKKCNSKTGQNSNIIVENIKQLQALEVERRDLNKNNLETTCDNFKLELSRKYNTFNEVQLSLNNEIDKLKNVLLNSEKLKQENSLHSLTTSQQKKTVFNIYENSKIVNNKLHGVELDNGINTIKLKIKEKEITLMEEKIKMDNFILLTQELFNKLFHN